YSQSYSTSDFEDMTELAVYNVKDNENELIINDSLTIHKGGIIKINLPFSRKDFQFVKKKKSGFGKIAKDAAGAVSAGALAVGLGSNSIGTLGGAIKVMNKADAVYYGADALEQVDKLPISKNAKKLAEVPDLSLSEIILLDKVAKNKQLSKKEIRRLKTKELIEGRKPNFHISSDIAEVTGEKVDYMKRRGIDDDYCRKMIIEYLEKFERAKRSDFEDLLLDKLPDVLSEEQKKNKVKNNLQYLRRSGRITTENRNWRLVK